MMAAPTETRRWSRRAIALAFAIATGVLVTIKLLAQLEAGPFWDTYAFLANAAELAGRSIGYTEPARPPMLSVLTAPFLALGPMHEGVIQIVEAVLSWSGIFALFLLIRRRVPDLAAAIAAFGLLLAPPVWSWLGIGYSDIPAIAFCAWTLLLFIKATDEHPAWYLLAFPFAVAAVMMRFPNLLFMPAVGVWVLLRWRPLRDVGAISGGVVAAVALYWPFGAYYASNFDDLFYPFTVTLEVLSAQLTTAYGRTFEPGSFPRELIAVLLVLGVTVLGGLAQELSERVRAKMQGRRLRLILAVVAVVFAIAAQFVGGLAARQATMALAVLTVAQAIGDREHVKRGRGMVTSISALDAAMLLWALAFADHWFHSTLHVPRYVIPMLPGILYFLSLGLNNHVRWLEENVIGALRSGVGMRPSHRSLLVVWSALALVLAFTLFDNLKQPAPTSDELPAIKKSALWIDKRVSSDPSAVVYSDWWPVTSWYLRREALPMPSFDNDDAIGHELERTDADYYVTARPFVHGPSFAKSFESTIGCGVNVLERSSVARSDIPRVQYIGDAWQNYLEKVCDYNLYLDHDLGVQGWDRSAFFDAYSSEELARADAVAVYNFRWRNRARAEQAFQDYLEHGGTVVIDASANFKEPAYMLNHSALFETAISRVEWPRSARVEVDPAFAARHKGVPTGFDIDFVGDGGAWFGAAYEPLRVARDWRVLASAGGRPLIAEQRIGSGRVIWIAANLVWHAKESGSAQEAALVRAVFEEATERPPAFAGASQVTSAQ